MKRFASFAILIACALFSASPLMEARGRMGGGGGGGMHHVGGGGGVHRGGGGGGAHQRHPAGHVDYKGRPQHKPDHGPQHKPDRGPQHKPDRGPQHKPDHGPQHGPGHGPKPGHHVPVPVGPHPKPWGHMHPAPPRPWHHPPMPPHWHPGPGIPPLPPILGIAVGTAFDVALNALIDSSYDIEGYTENGISVNSAYVFGCEWPEGQLLYKNGKLYGGQFTYVSSNAGKGQYQSAYNAIVRQFGNPASTYQIMGGEECTWYSSNGGFITLSYSRNTVNGKKLTYTILDMGN